MKFLFLQIFGNYTGLGLRGTLWPPIVIYLILILIGDRISI